MPFCDASLLASSARLALVFPGPLDGIAYSLLHPLAERIDLCALLALMVGVTVSAMRCPGVSTAMFAFEPLRHL